MSEEKATEQRLTGQQEIAASIAAIAEEVRGMSDQEDESVQEDVQESTNDQEEVQESVQSSTQEIEGKQKKDVYDEDYSPDHKYNVYDEVKEFDEWIIPVIKDKDTESKVRDLYTRAAGIEGVKTKLSKEREDKAMIQTELNNINRGLENFQRLLDSQLYDEVFKHLKIPEEQIIEYALDKAKRSQLSAEERAMLDSQDQMRTQNFNLQKQNEEMQRLQYQNAEKQYEFEMNSQLTRQDVKPLVDKLDSQFGNGFFRDQVEKEGMAYYNQNGRDTTIEDAVNTVITKFGKLTQAAATPPTTLTNTQPLNTITKTNQIRTIAKTPSGGGASPTHREINSIEDLQKIYNQKYGSGS